MSNERFIKFIDSQEADYLQEHHPNAFLLLCLIARRARRISGKPDGLEIGEAFIGDYKKAGVETEMKYRTAKKILQCRGHIKICETCRTRKKSTTAVTTVGTKVKILDSGIWNINPEVDNDRINDRITTNKKEEEYIKKKNTKEKGQPVAKIAFRESVTLTQSEYDTLLKKHGQQKLDEMLDMLDAYKGSIDKKYKSDYFTMKQGGWVSRQHEKDKNKPASWKDHNEENRKIASDAYKTKFSEYWELKANGTDVDFIPRVGQTLPITIKYSENGFREHFERLLLEKGFA